MGIPDGAQQTICQCVAGANRLWRVFSVKIRTLIHNFDEVGQKLYEVGQLLDEVVPLFYEVGQLLDGIGQLLYGGR